MKQPILFLYFVALVFLAVGCKSKKEATISKRKEIAVKEKEYIDLSKKLNLEVGKKDNVKLYSFVADWLGTPHQLGKCERNGIDCSCFIRLMYQQVYALNIPRSSKEMFDASNKIDTKELKEGDLVFFNIKSTKVSHVAVYLKDGWFAHVSTSKGVMINNLSEKYYAQYYLSGGRF